MKTDELLNEFDNVIKEGWNLPLTRGKIIVNANEVYRFLKEIRTSLPEEVKQAKAIASDRTEIIKKANKEANALIESAKEQAEKMINKSELVSRAKIKAKKIEEEAKVKAKTFQIAAQKYIFDLIKKTEKALASNIDEFQKISKKIRLLRK
ncbi:MAG: hypothetical protein LBF33_01280 [Oscillospiraceae bacterium]|jgi:2',3'-cyclic-nucleotide 2'-phosphodiesterase (5'-nucleotidase family)|nr:hypothetical protein [Oscillospiraceae bacterium]